MNLALTVLEVVAPVFILAAVGFAWVRLGHEYRIRFVTQLSMTLAVPCLLFTALMKTEIEPAALRDVAMAAAVAYLAITIVAWCLVRASGLNKQTFLAPLIFGNTGNLGLPLALFAFGDEGLGFAVVVFAIMSVYSFTFGVWLVAGGGSIGKVIKETMVAATLLGLLFLWQDWTTPRFLANALTLIGQMAIPLMLITLGVAIARIAPSALGKSLVLSVLKFVVCTGVACWSGWLFGLASIPFAVLILQVATPVAVTSYLLAEKYGADADAVAGLVVISTTLSVFTMPIMLAFVM